MNQSTPNFKFWPLFIPFSLVFYDIFFNSIFVIMTHPKYTKLFTSNITDLYVSIASIIGTMIGKLIMGSGTIYSYLTIIPLLIWIFYLRLIHYGNR